VYFCNSSHHDINSCPYYVCYVQPNFVSPWDNTDAVQSILDLSFPFSSVHGTRQDDPFGFDARFDVSDACFRSEDILHEVHDLGKTPLEGSRDVLVHERVS